MSAIRGWWPLAALMLAQSVLPTRSALADMFDVTGWGRITDPFSTNASDNSISAVVHPELLTNLKIRLTMSCNGGQVRFSVWTNGDLGESQLNGKSLTIKTRLDNYLLDQPVYLAAGKFSFTPYPVSRLFTGRTFLIGIPMEGDTTSLRIPLKDPTVAGFLSQCNRETLEEANRQRRERREQTLREGQAWLEQGDQGWNRLNTLCANFPNRPCMFHSAQDMIAGYGAALSQNVVPAPRVAELRSRVARACGIMSSMGSHMSAEEIQACQQNR